MLSFLVERQTRRKERFWKDANFTQRICNRREYTYVLLVWLLTLESQQFAGLRIKYQLRESIIWFTGVCTYVVTQVEHWLQFLRNFQISPDIYSLPLHILWFYWPKFSVVHSTWCEYWPVCTLIIHIPSHDLSTDVSALIIHGLSADLSNLW